MKLKEPWRRLGPNSFWSQVDAEHNRIIADQLDGAERVLDLGCGYGSLTSYLSRAGRYVAGVDIDSTDLARARSLFGGVHAATFMLMSGERLGFANHAFDAVVLRDALHHLYGEADIDKALAEVERTLRANGRLVVFDPQPNSVVLFCRRLVRHRDFQCSSADAVQLLKERGWFIESLSFTELFALPISGGYVGVCLMPPVHWLWRVALVLNRTMSQLLAKTPLAPFVLWRYVLVATPPGKAFSKTAMGEVLTA